VRDNEAAFDDALVSGGDVERCQRDIDESRLVLVYGTPRPILIPSYADALAFLRIYW